MTYPITRPSAGEQASSSARTRHMLHLDNRQHTTISGVTDVCSFQENEVVLKTDTGEMILTGQNLHIAKLLLEDGQLNIDGRVDSVIYQSTAKHEGKPRFWKRLFK